MPDQASGTMTDDRGLQPVRGFAALLEIARRRAVPMAVVFAAVAAAAGSLATLWPATYRATGTLLLVQPASTGSSTDTARQAAASLPAIGQRVMTPESLLVIARKHDLFAGGRDALPESALLERMRRATRVEAIDPTDTGPRLRPATPPPATERGLAFRVSYDAVTAGLAAAVASDLVALFMHEHPDDPPQPGDALAAEIEALEQRIAGLEQRGVATTGSPTAPDDVEQAERQLVKVTAELDDVNARLRALDRTPASTPEAADLVRRLEEARSWLAMDREQRPADDPEVQRLAAEVADLEQQLRETRRRAVDERRAALVARRDQLAGQATMLEEAARTQAADREIALRELGEAQARLAELRRQAAAAVEAGAADRGGERFMLLEPARAPQAPLGPNRAIILAVGLLLAAAAAVAMAWWREKADDRLRGPRAIETLFGEAPLAVVPWLG